MTLDLRALAKAFKRNDTIITQRYTQWLIQHGDEALDEITAERIMRLLSTPPRNRSASFSASGAFACERAQVFSYLGVGPPEIIDAQLQNIFNDGKWRHLRWQAAMLASGIITDVEDPLTWPRKRMVGTMDGSGVVPEDHTRSHWAGKEFGWELKGISTFQFARLDAPLEKHLLQTDTYFLMSGFPLFVFIYEDKTTQAWKEFVVEPDKARLAEREKAISRLNQAVDTKTLPPQLVECAAQVGPLFNKECRYGGRSGICTKTQKWPRLP